ncbi:ATP-dependent Clp protease ATP-binding subunit [Escherichia coli]
MENSAALLRRLNHYCARALEGAASLCQTRAHAEITPEHWLLKLLEQGEGDLTVLGRRYDWDMDAIWQSLLGWLDNQPRSVRSRPQLAQSLNALLKQAWMVASLQGEEHIRSVHLLGALTENPHLVRCDGLWPLLTLSQSQLQRLSPLLDAQSDECPETLQDAEPVLPQGDSVTFIGRPVGADTAGIPSGDLPPVLQGALDKFTRDITASAREGKIDPVSGRDTEIRQMVDILSRRRKNNPILVGDPGVGKTALADAANLLKPALARGELRTIAATTWSEYKQYLERDAALERRFQMVKVDEPDDETACLMLRSLKSRYAEHHNVHITDEAVRAAVTLSRRYLTERQLPDKAVDLLDTAAARVRMSLDTVPEQLTRIRSQLASLGMEKQALLEDIAVGHQNHGERLSAIEQEENVLMTARDDLEQQYARECELTGELLESRSDISRQSETHHLQQALHDIQQNQPLLSVDVDVRTVAGVVADWTGVPLSSLMKDEQTELLHLEKDIGRRVVGQDVALESIAQRLRAAKTGLTSGNGPQEVFLLVGPSGVGKTETALALADVMYGGEKSLITINLSEYQEPHTVSQLKGSPPGYVGYGQGGILTEAVRKRPYSVVLLDEVEKAHRDVLNLFYQVFDRGFMRDGEGREIDFRNTVILMTSNLGSDLLMQQLSEKPETTESELHELIRPLLRDHFQPALLARFQTVIYRPLTPSAMRTIVEMKLAQVCERLHCHYGLSTSVDERVYDALTSACLLPDTGARNVESLLNQQLLPVLSRQLLSHMAAKQKPQALALAWSDEDGMVIELRQECAL